VEGAEGGAADGGEPEQAVPDDARKLCTLVGCGFTAQVTLAYAGDDAALVSGTGRVCRNELCAQGIIQSVPMFDDTGHGTTISGDLNAELYVFRMAGALSVNAGIYMDQHTLIPGDIVTLTYRAQDGRVLVDGRWLARNYVEYTPNGPDCQPVCYGAQLETVVTP
jgi:hypothetical protein